METALKSQSDARVHWLLACAFLIIPYFYLREGGFDFTRGTSFTLGDLFLFMALPVALVRVMRTGIKTLFSAATLPMFVLGCVIVGLSILSPLTIGLLNEDVSTTRWTAVLSGTAQYGFVVLCLPLMAASLLSLNNIRSAIRLIALGYIPPLLLTIALMPTSMFPPLRYMFYFANRALGTYGNANSFAAVLLVAAPLYIYLLATESGRWRFIGYAGTVATIACMYLAASFSGFLTLGAMIIANILAYFFVKNHPVKRYLRDLLKKAGIVLLLSAVAFVFMNLYSPEMICSVNARLWPDSKNFNCQTLEQQEHSLKNNNVFRNVVLDQTMSTRMDLNFRALNLIAQRGITSIIAGHGMRQTTFQPAFTINGIGLDVHMAYLLLWIEGGFLLALAFGCYLLLLLKNCWNISRTHPAEALALASSVVALAVFCLFLPHTYLRYFWIPLLPAFIGVPQRADNT